MKTISMNATQLIQQTEASSAKGTLECVGERKESKMDKGKD